MLTEFQKTASMLSSWALILWDERWLMSEIVTLTLSDDGEKSIEVHDGYELRTVPVDDVVSFVAPNDLFEVRARVNEAHGVYLESERTTRDWDTFRVHVRLLV